MTQRRRSAIARAAAAAGIAALAAAALVARTARHGAAAAVPSFADVRASFAPSDVEILDRHGEVVQEQRVDPWRRRLRWTPLEQISPRLSGALIASEDHRFRSHGGVDWLALAAAAGSALRGSGRGASTIEMQLAALLDPALAAPRGRRGVVQKLAQVERALAIGRAWTKDQVLEAYLNLVSFRGELAGVAAAARQLFGKRPDGLSAAEAATLAALLRAPNAPRAALERRALGVAALVSAVSPRAEVELGVARATAAVRRPLPGAALAPHAAARLLANAGSAAAIQSTLDAALQRAAIDSLARNLTALEGHGARDGAVLVVDNESGDVLAYVGSSGRLSRAPQVDGVRARRQAGSTLKPFLYAAAIDRRLLTAASLLDDTPLEIAGPSGLYRPHNYDRRFRGAVSLRTALASSLNIPAVRTIDLLGEDLALESLHRFGFAGLTRPAEHYGPALALGGADVSLEELVTAYRALGNSGRVAPLRLTRDATGADGARAAPAVSPAAAYIVADVLADRESRSATFGLESPLATRFWSAVKTGTSKDMRDNWCIGFSRRYTVGVWVGNFSGAPMHDVSGVSGAAPVWVELMSRLHADEPSEPPPPPEGVARVAVSFPGDAEPSRGEWFVAGTEPTSGRRERAPERPHILSPRPATIFALDPDIPRANQRIAFSARGAEAGRLVLDGVPFAPARGLQLWPPRAGAHTLALVDQTGIELDRVAFEVRGAPHGTRTP